MVPWGTITNFHGLIVGKIDRICDTKLRVGIRYANCGALFVGMKFLYTLSFLEILDNLLKS